MGTNVGPMGLGDSICGGSGAGEESMGDAVVRRRVVRLDRRKR